MKILQSLINRGLNIITGVSSEIRVIDIEADTGKRITGNGSTIRRDTKPWSFFNIENIKERNKVVSYVFSGYKTRRELIGEVRHQNESSQKRVTDEQLKITDRENQIETLISGGRLDQIMFSERDTRPYL